ncbi:21489_t:CDS:1, partial [Dentiscutata erythropus]
IDFYFLKKNGENVEIEIAIEIEMAVKIEIVVEIEIVVVEIKIVVKIEMIVVDYFSFLKNTINTCNRI